MKKIVMILAIVISFFGFKMGVEAGNYTVSSTASSIFVGNKVTVTVKASNLAGKFKIVSDNGNVLSGGNSGIWIENETKSFTFTAKSLGTATISVVPIDVADLDNNTKFTVTKTIKVYVVSPSSNNNLKSLIVEGHTLTPEFNKDTLEYSLELENGTESIVVSATKEDSTSSVKGTGEVALVEGSNLIEIVVTAQNGNAKTYKINATVKELDPIEVTVGSDTYTVVRKKELMPQASSYYIESTVKINEEDVPSYYNDVTKITLVGLTNKVGETNLYVYENNSITLYEELVFEQLYIKSIDADPSFIPEGYTKSKLDISGKSVLAYSRENSDFYLIYGLNLKTGEKHLYKYDKIENTLQRYETIEDKDDIYYYIIIGMFGFIVLSYLIFIILIAKNNKKAKMIENTMRIDINKIQKVRLEETEEVKTKKEKKKKTKK